LSIWDPLAHNIQNEEKLEPSSMDNQTIASMIRRLGATQAGVWFIKQVVAPLDRRLYRWTNGRCLTSGRPLAPTLLLTTTGRKTGQPRTTPVFYVRDGRRIILCNVNPGFERSNSWTPNIRANPVVQIQIGAHTEHRRAREAAPEETAQYWPQLVLMWPAYQRHFEKVVSGPFLCWSRNKYTFFGERNDPTIKQ